MEARDWPPWEAPQIPRSNLWGDNEDAWLARLAGDYEAFRRTPATAESIPRVLHQIWLGPRPVPPSLIERGAAFCRIHPGWTRVLWRGAAVAALLGGNRGARRAFAKARDWAAKSDVARYYILFVHGGVYADVDVDFVRSFEPLLRKCNAFVGLANVRGLEVGNAVMGCAPGCALMAALVEACDAAVAAEDVAKTRAAALVAASGFGATLGKVLAEASAARTIETTGPGLLTRVYFRRAWDCACLPKTILYPVANDGTGGATGASITVHRWECSWKGKY